MVKVNICTSSFKKNRTFVSAAFKTVQQMARKLPKVLVFDLDGCTWWPEMYHLWGGGGSPFTLAANGNVKDRGNTTVEIMADLREILQEIKSQPQWNQTKFAVASSCDEPSWARECIRLISIGMHCDPKSKLSFGKSATYRVSHGKEDKVILT